MPLQPRPCQNLGWRRIFQVDQLIECLLQVQRQTIKCVQQSAGGISDRRTVAPSTLLPRYSMSNDAAHVADLVTCKPGRGWSRIVLRRAAIVSIGAYPALRVSWKRKDYTFWIAGKGNPGLVHDEARLDTLRNTLMTNYEFHMREQRQGQLEVVGVRSGQVGSNSRRSSVASAFGRGQPVSAPPSIAEERGDQSYMEFSRSRTRPSGLGSSYNSSWRTDLD